MAQYHPIAGDNDCEIQFGVMHRLDSETSGVLLCAKSYVGAYWIQTQWDAHDVTKDYLALVHGWVDPRIKDINKRMSTLEYVKRTDGHLVFLNSTVSDKGKPAYTELAIIGHFYRAVTTLDEAGDVVELGEDRFSLAAVKIHTGRTQQIQTHMQSIGHPLVSDFKHAEGFEDADRSWCSRNFLHTYHLGFHDVPEDFDSWTWPSGAHELMDVYCPLPEDLRTALSELSPVDKISGVHLEAWLSGDTARLRSFEEYSEMCVSDSASSASAS